MRTALAVFPAGDPAADAAAAACASAGWAVERATAVPPALLRLVRPAAGQPGIDLLLAAAGLAGLGAAGLAKAARSRPGCLDLPLILVGAAACDLPRSRAVAAGDPAAIAAAIALVAGPDAEEADLLDAGVIADLHALPGLWENALASFAAGLPRQLAELEAAAADLTALHACAHALKGPAGTLGARALHDALAAIVVAARRGDAAAVAARLPGVRPLAERSLAALRRS